MRWPRLTAPNVIVIAATTASFALPVVASTPVGRSTATIEAPYAREALIVATALAIAPRGAPDEPVPSSASTTIGSGAAVTSSRQGTTTTLESASSRSATASGDCAGTVSTTRTATPELASARATTQPSPPLLPGPVKTTTPEVRRGRKRSAISAATAAPARCIRARDGIPPAIAAASRAADCPLVTTKTRGRSLTAAARVSLVRDPDRASVAQLTVIDAHVETAIGVAARPRFVRDRRAIATVVAHWKQRSFLALPTARQLGRLIHFPSRHPRRRQPTSRRVITTLHGLHPAPWIPTL